MGSEKVRYAVGDVGKLFAFTGGDVPDGATPLIEEHDDRLTEAGKTYCTLRGHTPHPELIRVKFAQQTSEAVSEAATATVRNRSPTATWASRAIPRRMSTCVTRT